MKNPTLWKEILCIYLNYIVILIFCGYPQNSSYFNFDHSININYSFVFYLMSSNEHWYHFKNLRKHTHPKINITCGLFYFILVTLIIVDKKYMKLDTFKTCVFQIQWQNLWVTEIVREFLSWKSRNSYWNRRSPNSRWLPATQTELPCLVLEWCSSKCLPSFEQQEVEISFVVFSTFFRWYFCCCYCCYFLL